MATQSIISGIVEGTGLFNPACTFEVISGPGTLIDTTLINATLIPTGAGDIIVRVRSAQDPSKYDDVTVSAFEPAGLHIDLLADTLTITTGIGSELFEDQDVTDGQSNDTTITWNENDPAPHPQALLVSDHIDGHLGSIAFIGHTSIPITPVGELAFEAKLRIKITSAVATSNSANLFTVRTSNGFIQVNIQTGAGPILRIWVEVFQNGFPFTPTTSSLTTFTNGAIHDLGIVATPNGATHDIDVVVDGAVVDTIEDLPFPLGEVTETSPISNGGEIGGLTPTVEWYRYQLHTL